MRKVEFLLFFDGKNEKDEILIIFWREEQEEVEFLSHFWQREMKIQYKLIFIWIGRERERDRK